MKNRKSNLGIIILVLLIIVVVAVIFKMPSSTQMAKYSDILNYFEENKVSAFTLDLNNNALELTIKGEKKPVEYVVPSANLFVEQVLPMVNEYNEQNPETKMEYDIIPASNNMLWVNIGFTLLILLLIGGFWFFMFRQSGGGKAMSVGKARVKDHAGDKNNTTFNDVAGAEEEKEELQEIVEFLKDPSKFNRLGAKIPSGVLFVGPPGTGKTLLAKACAGEAKVPFYSISGSDFVEVYVGVGASRVRDLFEKAKKTAPSIIFIDEIDAIGRQRGTGLGGGHDEREQTLNQLLVEMDGFEGNEGVIVIAATNRADILDKALLRPGRFDRQVYVGYPDVKGREQILKVHTRKKPLAPDVDLKVIAKTTVRFTGADLSNLANEAALLAAKHGKKAITAADFDEARNKVTMGPAKRSRVRTEEDNKITAYHEAGHAITSYYLPTGEPVHEVTIIPRGAAGGYTMYMPEKDESYMSKRKMEEDMVSLLGGRVAEKIALDDITTGASNDLERATDIARSMVMRFGFSDRLGPVVYGTDPQETFLGRDFASGKNYSDTVAAEIDQEIRDMLDQAFEAANAILTEHRDKLDKVAGALLERETLSGDEFRKLMNGEELEDKKETIAENTDNKDGKLDIVIDDDSDLSDNKEKTANEPLAADAVNESEEKSSEENSADDKNDGE